MESLNSAMRSKSSAENSVSVDPNVHVTSNCEAVRSGSSNTDSTRVTRQYRCNTCDLSFMNHGLMMQHMSVVHVSRVKALQLLPVASSTDDSSHENKEPDACDYTKAADSKKGSVDDDTIDDHEIPSEIYLCSSCGEVFLNEDAVSKHRLLVHNEPRSAQKRVYECSQCMKRYQSEDLFNEHDCDEPEPEENVISLVDFRTTDLKAQDVDGVLEVELPNRDEFICCACDITFASKFALQSHSQIIHAGKNRKGSLAMHKQTGEWQCGKCFLKHASLSLLKRHLFNVHNVNNKNVRVRTSSVCPVCKKNFSCYGNMNKHYKRMHGNVLDNDDENALELKPDENVEPALKTFKVEVIKLADNDPCRNDLDRKSAETNLLELNSFESAEADKNDSIVPDSEDFDPNHFPDHGDDTRSSLVEDSDTTPFPQAEGKPKFTKSDIVSNNSGGHCLAQEEKSDTDPNQNAVNPFQMPDVSYIVADSDSVLQLMDVGQQKEDVIVATEVPSAGLLVTNADNETVAIESILTPEQAAQVYEALAAQAKDSEPNKVSIEIHGDDAEILQEFQIVIEDVDCNAQNKENKKDLDSLWYCNECCLDYDKRELLQHHYDTCHVGLNESLDREHASDMERENLMCGFCNKWFAQKSNREKHVNTVHLIKAYSSVKRRPKIQAQLPCKFCDKTFSSNSNRNKHLRSDHGQISEKRTRLYNHEATVADRTCQICNKVFDTLYKKEIHAYNHNRANKTHACPFEGCGMTFPRTDYLSLHYDKAHGTGGRYICRFCNKGFLRGTRLRVHERCHTGEKPYKCVLCDKGFAQWSGLYAHKRYHGPKPPATHFCSVCHKGYSYKQDLDRHSIVHSDRKHICKYCAKPFPSSSQLTVHVRTHTGERPYPCNNCSMAFMTMGALRRHDKTHEFRPDVGSFMCTVCGANYRRQASLLEHLRVVHDGHEESIEVSQVAAPADFVSAGGSEIHVANGEEIIEFVVQNDGTFQMEEIQAGMVVNRGESVWVDTTGIEKEIVEGILASQEGFVQSVPDS